ncbi:MAG: hypothetical protein OEU09_02530 [Rhodospirillales bacterium]|nr:hypothetical protein [Rhodospirillales bacterium]MDH3910144.1 hypothetical protein [Rhodospirillales bacterium]MDH3967495.1 hypothetical protein [Rhodospirillales bacterium]
MDPYELIAQGGDALIAGWLSLTLVNGLRLPEDESEEHQQLFLQGAKAALEQLAPAGAWIGERIQAVQFLCVHGAAMDWLGQADSSFLPEPVRDKARKIATQMFALTSRQLATLARLRDQRRREAEAQERRAWRERVQETKEQIARGGALTAELERMMKLGERAEGVAEETAGPAEAAPPDAPRSVGAAVPEPPPEPEAGLNRQQRRALERLERKAGRRKEAT